MREIRPSGSEGGVGQSNAPSLPLSKNPNTKKRRRRQSRHCSRVRWPRFPHLALRPHPSRHDSETASSQPAPYQKDVRRGVRRRDRGQRPTATKDPNTKQLRRRDAATVAGYVGPGLHNWPSGHIPQDTAPNPLLRSRPHAKKTFGEAFGAATGVSDPRLQKNRGARATTLGPQIRNDYAGKFTSRRGHRP
jgi:hypothetical protein